MARETLHRGEKAQRRKGTGRQDTGGRHARGEKARRKNAPLEKHSVVLFQCHFRGAFYGHTEEP